MRASLILPALLGMVLGTALQLRQPSLWSWSAYAAMVFAGVLAWVLVATHLSGRAWRTSLTVLALACAAGGVAGLRGTLLHHNALAPELEGRDLAVQGVVAAMPQRFDNGLRFRFDVTSAHMGRQTVRLPPRIYLSWYGALGGGEVGSGAQPQVAQPIPDLRAGERWQMTVRLKAPHGNLNPHGFDYELWLWEQGLQASGYVRGGPNDPRPQRLAQTYLHPVEWARQSVRDKIFERVAQRQSAGLIAALVVGDQNAIERADWDVFRATGVAHLMSISGLHVTMFAWLAALLVSVLWRRSGRLCLMLPAPTAALLGGVLLAFSYAYFSGWGVPSQRTVLMLATVAALRWSGRQWPWPHVWLLACVAVLLADPWALLQAGFWLSFVAVGVLFATGPGVAHAPPSGARARVKAMFAEQWVITLALTPLTLLLFGQVSLVGLAANALAIPWVTLVITPLAMLGVLVAPLWDLAGWAIVALTACLQALAMLPFATVSVAQAPLWAGVAGVAGGLLLAMRWPLGLRLQGLPLILPVLLWQAPRPTVGEFELLAADVGQGNAVLVRTAKHALVYDAGPRFSRESDAGHRVLVPLLRALGERVDTVVLSHRDSDHTGGAQAVLAMQPQALMLSSIEDSHPLQTHRPAARCLAGERWRWDGVDFELLHPTPGDYMPGAKPNALSCVLRIGNGRQTALLVGDIEAQQEAALVQRGAALKADVLLVPHHGSKTSSSEGFLDAVSPRIALVQSGYRNRFGHPAPVVMARYAARQVRVVDSPHCGAADWRSAEPDQVRCQRDVSRRYWHHFVP
ncbi:DNA internalization-related competence protein ComEC/Rec2 [Rhodoferax sp.]|uniref:DNA internalization-related competence protein ComEC/Rec2 n=1 Tax=Rhodoferax sp. TaxID=50421 RepID=UPI00276C7452|nr:DNA internalization-related competence protein ComEC/Rec2 [Rhodoferax sp.]